MRNIFIIARKELLSTFRQRNLILIMFLSPIVLVAIMGLAFGGLGGSGAPDLARIRVAVVNQDEGFDLQQRLGNVDASMSLADLSVEVGGQTLNLGETLLQNPNLELQAGDFAGGDFALNLGDILASILLSQPLTASSGITSSEVATSEISTSGVASGGFDLSALSCSLFETDGQKQSVFEGALAELFDAQAVGDAAVARAGVERGDFAAAVIITPDFSNRLVPDFGLGAVNALTATESVTTESVTPGIVTSEIVTGGIVHVVANNATPISASIVRAVVEGIVSQFERADVALSALALVTIERLTTLELDGGAAIPDLAPIGSALQNVDGSVLEPLGCLLLPGTGNIEVARQPLSEAQTRTVFSMIMVALGGSQAIFFALFTGVFGINAIYEDRRQGTLQRVLASPTPSSHVLLGRLLGNLVIVFSQLCILMLAFTTIASLVEGKVTFIWGTNLPALLPVIAGLSLFTTGLGVLIVGLAQTSEQVQLVGPMITLALGALGGTFGSLVPDDFARFSPIWWGVNAFGKLASNEMDIGLHILVLFAAGVVFVVVGTFFFRRRMGL